MNSFFGWFDELHSLCCRSGIGLLARRKERRFVRSMRPSSNAIPELTNKGSQVVLVHGFSVPSIIWKDVAPRLAASGYRVLLYGEPPFQYR